MCVHVGMNGAPATQTRVCNPVLTLLPSHHPHTAIASPSFIFITNPVHASMKHHTPFPSSAQSSLLAFHRASRSCTHQVGLSSKLAPAVSASAKLPDAGLPLHSLVSPRFRHDRSYFKLTFDYSCDTRLGTVADHVTS